MLGLAGAPARKGKTEHLCQMVLGLATVQLQATHLQAATRTAQEALDQMVGHALEDEVQLHLRCRAGLAVGAQVGYGAGAVTLEEGGADGPHQRALASLVGAGQDVQARCETRELQGLAETPQLFDAQAGDLEGP